MPFETRSILSRKALPVRPDEEADAVLMEHPDLIHWFDANPAYWRLRGEVLSWRDKLSSLVLASTGKTPPTGAGSTPATYALAFKALRGLGMQPNDPADLAVTPNAWSLGFVATPEHAYQNAVFGTAKRGAKSATDLTPFVVLRTYPVRKSVPALLTGDGELRMIAPNAPRPYTGHRTAYLVTFDADLGFNMWCNGAQVLAERNDRRPLTDGRFQFGAMRDAGGGFNFKGQIHQWMAWNCSLSLQMHASYRKALFDAWAARHGIALDG